MNAPAPPGTAPSGAPRSSAQAGWSWGFDGGHERLPWVGIFLIAFGVALLVAQATTPVSAGALLLDALGATFLLTWLVNGARGAMLPALIFIALGLATTLSDLGVISGGGWGTLFLGVAFGLAWLMRRTSGGGHGWEAWAALLFVVLGGVQVAGRVPGWPDLGRLWPVLIVLFGLWLIWRARRRTGWG